MSTSKLSSVSKLSNLSKSISRRLTGVKNKINTSSISSPSSISSSSNNSNCKIYPLLLSKKWNKQYNTQNLKDDNPETMGSSLSYIMRHYKD